MPRMVVVTKEDKARADFRHVLADLRDGVRRRAGPARAAAGRGDGVHGRRRRAQRGGPRVRPRRPPPHARPLPAGLADEEHRLHDEVTEEIVAHDDDQLERYLSGEVPDRRRAGAHARARGARPARRSRCSSASGRHRRRRRPARGPAVRARARRRRTGPPGCMAGQTEVEVAADPAGPTLLYAFRTLADPFVGQVTMFRVLSGTVPHGDRLLNTTTRDRGAHPRAVPAARQGAPAGRRGRRRGDRRRRQAHRDPVGQPAGGTDRAGRVDDRPAPARRGPRVYALALEPVTQSDDDRLSAALARLVAEDPTLRDRPLRRPHGPARARRHAPGRRARAARARVRRAREHRRRCRSGTGRRSARPVEAEGKVKKQSGGHGQFAVVQLRVSPLPHGSGFEFVDSDRRRRDPAHLPARPCTRRHRGDGRRAARTGTRWSTCASRSTTASRTRSTPPTWRSAPPPATGVREALHAGGHDRARTRQPRVRHGADRRAGRRDERPVRAARAHQRDHVARRRPGAHRGVGAGGRAGPVRAGPALAHRRAARS